mgnify:CR=1 FL=1
MVCLAATQAKYKNYVSLENDSLIQVAVDYFEKNSDRERLAKSYFYSGCVHREQEDISTAINLYLKSLRTMPQGGDSAFLSMVYNDLEIAIQTKIWKKQQEICIAGLCYKCEQS